MSSGFFIFSVENYRKNDSICIICVNVCACVCVHMWSGALKASKSMNAGYGIILWICAMSVCGDRRECGKYVKLARLLSTSQSTCVIYKPQKRWGFHRSRDLLCGNHQKTIPAMESCDAGVCMNASGLLLRMKAKKNKKTKEAELGIAP